jgi:hypothetical protein
MPMILLLYKKVYFNTNELDLCIFSIYVTLLQKFKDVFLDEIQSGLPLIREIEHQIDLVPSSAISNIAAYRSNHEKIKMF